jgi:23S rRNA (adenine2503-C2)-methyltransferase
MGEPLHNIDNVIKAADIMVDDQGLHFSPRKVTVSTSGLVPQLRRFLQESNCTIAVSLNATTDEVIVFSLMLLVGTEVVMKRQEQ